MIGRGLTYGSVGRAPHLFEVELLDAGLIRSNGSALDTNTVFENGIGGVYSDLVVGLSRAVARGDQSYKASVAPEM